MKTIQIIIIVMFSSQLYAQLGDSLRFVDYTPLWNHSIIDSVEVDNPEYEGSLHLGKVKFFQETDSTAYIITDIRNYQGAYIEKINTLTGELLWHNRYVKEDTGAEENNLDAYVNDDGNLELINFRNINPEGPYFASYGDSQFAIRVYDGASGSLISHKYQVQVDTSQIVSNDISLRSSHGKVDGYNVVIDRNKTKGKFGLVAKYIDENAKIVKKDSFYIDKKYKCFSIGSWQRLKDNSFLFSTRSTVQCPTEPFPWSQDSFDIFDFWVHLYDENLVRVKNYDLAEYLPYSWRMNAFPIGGMGGTFAVHCSDSTFWQVLPHYEAYVMFDLEGNYIETIDLGKYEKKYFNILKLYHESGFLLIETEDLGFEKNISFYKTDGSGNKIFLKNFKIDDNRLLFNQNSIQLLKNNTILFPYTLTSRDGIITTDSRSGVFVIPAEDIGLMTGVSDPSISLTELSIAPNPAMDQLLLSWGIAKTGTIVIYDMMGNRVKHMKIEQQENLYIDIRDIPVGSYSIVLQMSGETSVSRFVKM